LPTSTPCASPCKRETLSGDFIQINGYLIEELKQLGLWTTAMRDAIKMADGSVQEIEGLPAELKQIYRTAWELPMKAIIEMAATRGAFIDQSQSLNLFMASPNIGQLSSMYMYAWKCGLKTTYYLRSRPATRIAKTTVPTAHAIACSLENPQSCEAANEPASRAGFQLDAAPDAHCSTTMCLTKKNARAFAAIDNIPSINKKARFCQRWIDSVSQLNRIETADDKRQFLLNLTCFASCI
jgi:ribonucleotide reductase alpha subunit